MHNGTPQDSEANLRVKPWLEIEYGLLEFYQNLSILGAMALALKEHYLTKMYGRDSQDIDDHFAGHQSEYDQERYRIYFERVALCLAIIDFCMRYDLDITQHQNAKHGYDDFYNELQRVKQFSETLESDAEKFVSQTDMADAVANNRYRQISPINQFLQIVDKAEKDIRTNPTYSDY